MSKLVHFIVCFLLWLGRVLSCPEDCYCTSNVVYGEDGTNVDCAHASLAHLPSISRSAVTLDFSNNILQVIPPEIKSLTHLRELDLSNNRLGYDSDDGLPDNIFSTLVYLEVLDLSGNHLSTLSSNTFYGLVQLEKLDLDGNELVHLPLGMLQLLPNTAVVCLGGNYWECSMCQFHETLEWYQSNDRGNVTNVCNREVPSCFYPRVFRGRTFTEVNLEEIRECDEEKVITTSSTFISTPTDLSTELSNVTVGSQHLNVSANTHTSNAHTTTNSPEFYSNSGKASFQMRKLGSWSWFLLIIAFLAPKMATGQTIKSSLLIMGLMTKTFP